MPYNWTRWGKRVKGLREERDWTQRELAWNVKTSRVTIARLELGIRRPSVEMLERLADAFHITLADLMTVPRRTR